MTRRTARRGRLAGALIASTIVLAGCADDSSGAVGNGHTMGSNDASGSTSTDAETTHNDADVTFVQGMLPHHEGAISMAELALARAADPRVLDLANRIKAAQAPEIDTLTGWLSDWGAGDEGGMDHGEEMRGMSQEDITALTDASGTEFDRLFLTRMIAHHRGATAMAEQEAANGQNADAIVLAESIRDSQSREVAEMQALLSELGG